MAFPTVADRTTNGDGSAGTSHSISVSASSGHLLLVNCVCRDSTGTFSWAGGWTQIYQRKTRDQTSTNDAIYSSAYRVSDGTETTVVVTTSATVKCAWSTYRISGQHASSAPEAQSALGAASTAPDSDSLTPSWGAEDTLWFTFFGAAAIANVDVFPSSYSNGQQFSTSAGTSVTTGAAERQLNATSEDPGAFTIASVLNWGAATIAVRTAAPTALSAAAAGITRIRRGRWG